MIQFEQWKVKISRALTNWKSKRTGLAVRARETKKFYFRHQTSVRPAEALHPPVVLTCPHEGWLNVYLVTEVGCINVEGRRFSLPMLLGGENVVQPYCGGYCMVLCRETKKVFLPDAEHIPAGFVWEFQKIGALGQALYTELFLPNHEASQEGHNTIKAEMWLYEKGRVVLTTACHEGGSPLYVKQGARLAVANLNYSEECGKAVPISSGNV